MVIERRNIRKVRLLMRLSITIARAGFALVRGLTKLKFTGIKRRSEGLNLLLVTTTPD